MSIDYNRLRDLVRIAGGGRSVRDYTTEHDAERDLENLAPDMARELLRLRDGVQDIRGTCAFTADVCRSSEYPEEQAVAGNLESVARALTDLLEGDTE